MKTTWRLLAAMGVIAVGFLLGTALGGYAGRARGVFQMEGTPPRIILDAGHGGEDGGTSAPNGKPESAYNLEITLRLRDMLSLLGYPARMIRTEDVSVYTEGDTIARKKVSDLRNRVKAVNAVPNGILVSIHQNFYGDSRYRGAQVFYGGGEESKTLAALLQERLLLGLDPSNNRKIKRGEGIYLLDKTQGTRVLVECGFLSNPQEAAALADGAYQKRIAAVLAAALAEYLGIPESGGNPYSS